MDERHQPRLREARQRNVPDRDRSLGGDSLVPRQLRRMPTDLRLRYALDHERPDPAIAEEHRSRARLDQPKAKPTLLIQAKVPTDPRPRLVPGFPARHEP